MSKEAMKATRILTEVEVEELFLLCSAAEEHDEESWNRVREWLETNVKNSKLLAAAVMNQEEGETSLHVILTKRPPLDIVRRMVEIAPNILRIEDSNKMLPLHVACKHSASVEVIDKLIQGAPIAVRKGDMSSWLPIHFACGNPEISVDVVSRLLRDANDTVWRKTDREQLPIHLACASRASLGEIQRLLKDAPETVRAIDYLSRTPLLLARNYGATPEVIDFLEAVTAKTNEAEKRQAELAKRELETIMSDCGPQENERLWKSLKEWIGKYRSNSLVSIPEECFEKIWNFPIIIRDIVARDKFVQSNLNRNFCKRDSIALLMLDFYCFFLMIPIFYILSTRQITYLFSDGTLPPPSSTSLSLTIVLFVLGAYEGFRGLLRVVPILLTKSLVSIVANPLENFLQLVISIVVLFMMIAILSPNAFVYESSNAEKELFRHLTALCIGILCMEAWEILTKASLKFAVTSNGVIYVMKRIFYFVFVLFFVIISFSFIFNVLYLSTNICENPENFSFCRLGTSIIELYLFLYGSVDYTYFFSANGVELDPQRDGNFGVLFYALYMFLVVILFLNLLVAIIVDSYTAVSGDAEASFWTQRMLFVHDVHEIRNLSNFIAKMPLWKRLKCCRSPQLEENSSEDKSDFDSYGRHWDLLVSSFPEKRKEEEKDVFNSKCWIFTMFRFLYMTIIFLWVILGFLSAGLLWSPQIREWLFQALTEKENGKNDIIKEERAEMELLNAEILNGNQTISTTIGMVNSEIGQLKLDFTEMKQEAKRFKSDLEEIKKMLVDFQLLFRSTNS
eukprot:CAMPEP_0172417238 /NCGR_PEP_ID=MMETSP1064-20121228/3763_1 /TAXON_ID=202472 /ORGANISM="Aulacoseira subarctica , Strain CCAP 1002/5" /LENGTH=792 /DNA_ID=CAMNT_0013155445 /DNA_START=96 /DNA_END=2474 /DNA_ORIENTATION=+